MEVTLNYADTEAATPSVRVVDMKADAIYLGIEDGGEHRTMSLGELIDEHAAARRALRLVRNMANDGYLQAIGAFEPDGQKTSPETRLLQIAATAAEVVPQTPEELGGVPEGWTPENVGFVR